MMISNNLISEAIKKLECGKSAGPDGVHAEAIKYVHPRMHVLLSFCFSLCCTHGYMPANMIETTIVPIIKNKCGNLADSNNYRPIAIATIVSKLFESVIYINARRSYTHVIISSDLNLSTVLNYVFTH